MRHLYVLAAMAALAACHSTPPDTDPAPDIKPVRVMSAASGGGGVAYGDCAEALRRASAKPDLEVDRLPEPVKYDPPPIPRLKKYPKGVFGKDTSEVRIQVLVDTLGHPAMETFTIVKSTHPWLSKSIRASVGMWSFTPAELAGCKVPRVFKFAVVSPPLGRKKQAS